MREEDMRPFVCPHGSADCGDRRCRDFVQEVTQEAAQRAYERACVEFVERLAAEGNWMHWMQFIGQARELMREFGRGK